jgi:hypothetical protein
MTKGDLIVERGANLLEELSRKMAAEGGFAAKLAEPLAEDAVFLRKLKPSLVAARLRGEAPTNGPVMPAQTPAAPPGPQLPPRPKFTKAKGGPNPFLIAGAAFAVGVLVAKVIDWRGHAHPRD